MNVGVFPAGTTVRHVAEVSAGAQITDGRAPLENSLLKLPHVLRVVELPVREVRGIPRAPLALHVRFAVGRRNDAPVLSIGVFSMDLAASGQSVPRWNGAAH